jgi:hypothetical protein
MAPLLRTTTDALPPAAIQVETAAIHVGGKATWVTGKTSVVPAGKKIEHVA